jgi:hypothetical protein
MSMVERVARALYERNEARSNVLGPPWEKLMELPMRLHYEEMARVAVEAMREPTAEMVAAVIAKYGYLPGGTFWADVHNTMIDAALKEQGSGSK